MSEEEIMSILKVLIGLEEFNKISYKENRAIQGLLDLYKQEKDKNKELENDNAELRRLMNKLSIATAIALDGRKISISKKLLNELNDMFSIEVEYRPLYGDYVFYAK